MHLDRLDLAALECAAKQLRQIINDREYAAALEMRFELAKERFGADPQFADSPFLRLMTAEGVLQLNRAELQQSVDRLESLRHRLSGEIGEEQ